MTCCRSRILEEANSHAWIQCAFLYLWHPWMICCRCCTSSDWLGVFHQSIWHNWISNIHPTLHVKVRHSFLMNRNMYVFHNITKWTKSCVAYSRCFCLMWFLRESLVLYGVLQMLQRIGGITTCLASMCLTVSVLLSCVTWHSMHIQCPVDSSLFELAAINPSNSSWVTWNWESGR